MTSYSENELRWRKSTDVDREYALFELLAGETPLLDVGFSDENVFEVAIHEGASGWIVSWDDLQRHIDDGRRLAIEDQ
jgi:hypothetical protein